MVARKHKAAVAAILWSKPHARWYYFASFLPCDQLPPDSEILVSERVFAENDQPAYGTVRVRGKHRIRKVVEMIGQFVTLREVQPRW
jgi:hypothetical protein